MLLEVRNERSPSAHIHRTNFEGEKMNQKVSSRSVLYLIAGLLAGVILCNAVISSAQRPAPAAIPLTTFVVFQDSSSTAISYSQSIAVGDDLFLPNLNIYHYRVTRVEHQVFALSFPNEFHRRLLYVEVK
jgi:hypothetical protein